MDRQNLKPILQGTICNIYNNRLLEMNISQIIFNYNYYHSYDFIRRFNWPRHYYVTANNCLRIIVFLQIMVCSCAVQSTSNHNGDEFLRVIGERFYLFIRTKTHF